MTSSSSGLNDPGTLGFMYAICAVAVVCNLVVLVVIAWSKRLRSSTDIYLVNLAVSDVLMSGIAMPLKLMNAAAHDFYGGNLVCKIVMFVPMFTIMSCISTMVAISFDRYYAIVRTRNFTTRHVLLRIAFIWVLSVATSSPQIYEYSVAEIFEEEENETESVCGSHGIPERFEMYYAIVVLIVCYIAPLVIMCGCYGRLIYYIWQKSNVGNLGISADGTSRQGHVSRVKLKILKMLVAVTAVFAVLWMPYFIMFTIEEITDTDDIADVTWLHAFKTILVALSTVSNPVLYALLNANFRREMRALVTCHQAVGPMPPDTRTVTVTNVPS